MCGCSGNCGWQPCTFFRNRRRCHIVPQLCDKPVYKSRFCVYCKCDIDSCKLAKAKVSRRRCGTHHNDYKDCDFATREGPGAFTDADSLPWRVALKTNYLHHMLMPDDDTAFQELAAVVSPPRVGNPMISAGVVALVVAHAIKWPPCVRYFRMRLTTDTDANNLDAVRIVDAYHATLQWADRKPFRKMHDILSRAGRAHSCSGLAVTALQLGVTTKTPPAGEDHRVVNLGPVGSQYFLKNREKSSTLKNWSAC